MRAELTSLPTLSYYQVEYHRHPPLITGANQRPLTAEEITETCELLLAAAKRHTCPYWMLDGRSHQHEQPQELHDWMREEYFPRVKQELGLQPCIAFLVPEAIWAGLPSKGYNQPTDWHSHAAHMGWFMDESAAHEWLGKQRNQSLLPLA